MRKPTVVAAPSGLLACLVATWPEVKRTRLKQWLKHQMVMVNGRPVTQFDHPLVPGDTVAVREARDAAPRAVLPGGIAIRFEDACLLVIDKPAGLLSIASEAESEKTAYFQLTDYLRSRRSASRERVWIVHRLDRETSGLMVFAKTPEAKESLQSRWETFEKSYEAVAEGRLKSDAGTFESDLDESNPYRVRSAPPGAATRHAVTHFRVLARGRSRTLVELTLQTGRRHQIRVHLAEAGCPVVGDQKYGATSDPVGRLALHAVSLRFLHPTTGDEISFTSPLPGELAKLVEPRRAPAKK